jgi:hypothetical protein
VVDVQSSAGRAADARDKTPVNEEVLLVKARLLDRHYARPWIIWFCAKLEGSSRATQSTRYYLPLPSKGVK